MVLQSTLGWITGDLLIRLRRSARDSGGVGGKPFSYEL